MLDSLLLVVSALCFATLVITLALVREVRWRRALQKLVSRLLTQLRRGASDRRLCWLAWACMLGVLSGCGSTDERLVQLSEQNSARQAEQNREVARQSRELTSTVHELVVADAEGRKELLTAEKARQQLAHAERQTLDTRRGQLDREAADLAAAKHREPLVAAAITGAGVLLACLLPLLLCGYLLRVLAQDPGSDELATLLTYELVADEPSLLTGTAPAAAQLESEPPA